MDLRIDFRIITKNHAADKEIGFLTKSISKLNGYATAMPTAWELKLTFLLNGEENKYNYKITLRKNLIKSLYRFPVSIRRQTT